MNTPLIKSKIFTWILAGCFIVSLGANIYFLYPKLTASISDLKINDDEKIAEITNYLDSISVAYAGEVEQLAKRYNVPSWGCGPSTHALARILNDRFFDSALEMSATYENHPHEIVQRFGLAIDGTQIIDHSWLEIYFHDKVLFIDPTIGQFGKFNGIAYEIFQVGTRELTDTLKQKYGILDVRMRVLLQKALNRVPKEGEPYAGIIIHPEAVPYYKEVVRLRNEVDLGEQPPEWNDWIATLVHKY